MRQQPLRALLAVVAIAAGVSLAVASLIDQTSFSHALHRFGAQTAGPAPLRVIGASNHGGVSQLMLDRVAAVPGVEAAVPMIETVSVAEDEHGHPTLIAALGIDCRAEALVGALGCSADAVSHASDTTVPILSPRLARRLGRGGAVRTDFGRTPVATAVTVPRLDHFNFGRVAIFPLPVAQRVFVRPDSFDVVYIKPSPHVPVTALRRMLAVAAGPTGVVLEGADAPPQAHQPGPTFGLLAAVGLFALAIGGQLVYNTVSLSLEERR